MNTASRNRPAQTPAPTDTDLLLAEAMQLTSDDYEAELPTITSGSTTEETRASSGPMIEVIRSDDFLSPFAGRPEFIEWAMLKAADQGKKDISEVSANEVKKVLAEPREKLADNLLELFGKRPRSFPLYVREPLRDLLKDPRAWKGQVGFFMSNAADDIHFAHAFGANVQEIAKDRGLALFDVLKIVRQSGPEMIRDTSWRKAPDPAAAKAAVFRNAFESKQDKKEAAETAAVAGSQTAGCVSSPCAVAGTPLVPVLARELGWAQQTDPCDSMEYLRYLVYMYAIGENGQLFRAGELLSDRWAQATNWCWPTEPAEQTERDAADCQSFDDVLYWLRRRNARSDTAYAMRNEIYQQQLGSPAIQQAWDNLISKVQGYLSAPCTGTTVIRSYRCVGIYNAAETLRRAAAAQLTGLARMQIKDLASSLQIVWRLFTDPRVAGIVNPAATGSQQLPGTAGDTGTSPADQAVVVFGVAQQLLGPQASGLYQAWDRAMLLDQVFTWVQGGHTWKPEQGCEEDPDFVKLLGAMSALVPGAESASPSASLAPPT